MERQQDHTLVSIGEPGKTPRARFRSPRIILALPPRLAAATILFTPDLPFERTQAMLKMGTWMAGQAKFYALYPKPYWRQRGFSGQGLLLKRCQNNQIRLACCYSFKRRHEKPAHNSFVRCPFQGGIVVGQTDNRLLCTDFKQKNSTMGGVSWLYS